MTAPPQDIIEMGRRPDGSVFSGAGPHRINTGRFVPPGGRFGFSARFLVLDTATGDLLYDAFLRGSCRTEGVITTGAVDEVSADPAWVGNVAVDVLIVDNEAVADVLIPIGYDVLITYRLQALTI
jgi:hypothetical protein